MFEPYDSVDQPQEAIDNNYNVYNLHFSSARKLQPLVYTDEEAACVDEAEVDELSTIETIRKCGAKPRSGRLGLRKSIMKIFSDILFS